MTGETIPMLEAVARLRALGLTVEEIGEGFARTGGPSAEEPLDVVREILARREQSSPGQAG